jgi:cell division protein FtsW
MDPLLILAQLLLGALGVLGVAGSAPADQPMLWLEQARDAGLGILIVALVSRLSPARIARFSPVIYISSLLLLVLVLTPLGIAPPGSPSQRWLDLGFGTIQPSEFMKVAVIAYLAAFFHNHVGNWEIWRPMVVIGLAAALILMEPNVSTTAFIFALALAIMMAAGTNLFRLASITFAAALIAVLLAVPRLGSYEVIPERFAAFFDAMGDQEYRQDISYQPVKAQQILIDAGFFGIGPGRPVRVPEAHTDLIAVAVGQALGFTGILTLIFLFIIIAGRGIRIASEQHGPGSLLAIGATAYICGQAALNLLVATGIFPVTGVVLPFVSHGFNGLISVSIAMGFLQSAYRQAKREGARL